MYKKKKLTNSSFIQPQFKKRPLAQLMTLTLSLAGYGIVQNHAHAFVLPDCNLSTPINTSVENTTVCESTNPVEIENDGTLTNSSSLTNSSTLETSSSSGGTSKLTNAAGATLTNNVYLNNYSDGNESTSTLTNSGTLNNDAELNNASWNGGTSTLTNTVGATLNNTAYAGLPVYHLDNYSNGSGSNSTLTNDGTLNNIGVGLYNSSANGGTSTLTNSGTLNNVDDGLYPGVINNVSVDENSTSTLTNTVGGVLYNNGIIRNSSDQGGTATLVNEGTLDNDYTLYNDSDVVGSTTTLTNKGTLNNNINGFLYNRSSGDATSTLTNALGATVNNEGYIENEDAIVNEGTFDITTTGALYNESGSTFTQTSGSTVVNGEIDGDGVIDIQGGSISGNGTIAAEHITIGENATVNPGNSPGTLNMSGYVDLFGTLETEIVSTSLYDVLAVDGTVELSNTSHFNFMFDGAYNAMVGDSFNFLSAMDFDFGNPVNSDFFDLSDLSHYTVTGLSEGFDWSISYFDNSGSNDYSSLSLSLSERIPTAVPEPSTLGIFGFAFALMGWLNRRRIKQTS